MSLHPHSDLALYETLVGLAQPFNKLNVLVDPQGNVGAVDDFKSYAAQRYVEMRMSSFTNDIFFQDMNKAYIPMKDNYDNSTKEPIHLPARFPMILNMGNIGIGSGFASEMPTHKVDDICNLTVRYIASMIKGKEISDKDLIADFRPDFPMGGIITNASSLVEMYTKGQGSIQIDSNIEESTYNGKPVLRVKDLPYKISTSKVMQQIQDLVGTDPKTKQPKALNDKVMDIKDLSSKTDPVNLVIIPKKDVTLAVLKNLLYQHTSLRSSVKYLPNVLIGNDLVEFATIRQILDGWLNYRKNTLLRKFNYIINRNTEQRLLKEALIKAHSKIDKVIAIIKTSEGKEDAVEKVKKLLSITAKEATYIVSIQLYQLSKLEVDKLKDEIAKLIEDSTHYLSFIADDKKLLNLIKEDLESIAKKYKSERRTVLTDTNSKDFDVRSVIESEDLIIGISKDNFVYAKPANEMREYVSRGAKGANFLDAKYKRVIRDIMTVNSHDDLFVFTNMGKVIELKGYQLNLWNKNISVAIPDLGDQEVVTVVKANPVDDAEKYFTFVTANSIMKHVAVSDMVCQRKMQGGNIAIKIEEDGKLIGVALIESGDDRIVITSNLGRAQNLLATDITPMLRPTRGFPKATLSKGEYIIGITVIPKAQVEDALLLVAADNGIGKLTPLKNLPERRGESGKRSLMKIITLKGDAKLVCGLLVMKMTA